MFEPSRKTNDDSRCATDNRVTLFETMIWDEIIGQPEVIARLRAAVEGKEASHAFVFWGPEGVGKRKAARVFAAALNCAEGVCGLCLSCKKVLGGIHPDVHEVEPEGNFITIDQVRSVQHWAHLKPSEGRAKVFVVDEADRMNTPAANAFLKTLEEPPAACFFVLITSQLENMLPTVISRCQPVRFNAISTRGMKEFLMKEKGLGAEIADMVSRASGGVLEYALALAESEETREKRKLVLSLLARIDQKDAAELLEQAQEIVSAIQGPLSELKENQEEELGELVELAISSTHATHLRKIYTQHYKREATRKENKEMQRIFDLFSSWYADLLSLKQGLDEKSVVNLDYLKELRAKSQALEEAKILKSIDVIRHGREMMGRNVHSLLVVETVLLRLADLGK